MADEKKSGVAHGIEDSIRTIVKELIAGGVAGGVAKTAVAPFERVKILFQTRRAEFQSIGLFGSFRKIAQTEGLLGFYRGNGASVARIVPYAALHYMAYEQYRRWVILGYPDIGRGPVLDLVAGSFAGGTAVMFTYPLDLVRTKLAYQVFGSSRSKFRGLPHPEHFYEGILDCISKIYKRTGIRGLYRGVGPTLYGIFPYSGLKFYFYEEMKTHVPEEHKRDIIVKLACGSVAGLLGQTVTYPLDVVRRQMQVQALSSSDPAKGTLESLVMIIRNQGWRQLFSGLSINYMKESVEMTLQLSLAVRDGEIRIEEDATEERQTNRREKRRIGARGGRGGRGTPIENVTAGATRERARRGAKGGRQRSNLRRVTDTTTTLQFSVGYNTFSGGDNGASTSTSNQ